MTRKQRRATLILSGLAVLFLAVGLIVYAGTQKGAFDRFYITSDAVKAIEEKKLTAGSRIRLGGIVEKGSLKRDGIQATFNVTDTLKSFKVTYVGKESLPDLFREEQGVVLTGTLGEGLSLVAETVVAKHDENYMPPEVAKALKEKGVWQEEKKGKK
ncbi:MAG: cytochrome c maturation protein CcmE [Hyphomicrobiaceae bacterium]|nr:MAG: cytochrome c maturation protein CcmE [Hyphomicrobiaceae bacterium]